MRILITNDDGIQGEGLLHLVNWARKLGEVVVAAPKFEQSGKSHGIEIHKPFEVKEVSLVPGVKAYSVDSTPADCVRFAILGLHEQFDLVISGVNKGLNIGCDIMYSGTVGAIFEAAALGVRGVAVSTEPESYDHATEHLDEVLNFFLKNDLLSRCDIYNVNIPQQVSGFRITRQGGPYYSDDFEKMDGDMYMPRGKCVFADRMDDTLDTDATMHGYISIMPLTTDRADCRAFAELSQLNK